MTRKILIVDDSKLARMAVLKALGSLRPDWTTLEAADADTALEAVRTEAPDVALVDFNMPGKDGLLLATQIREFDPRIRTALISANHQVEVINRAHAAGAGFLRKPITVDALREFLENMEEPRQEFQ